MGSGCLLTLLCMKLEPLYLGVGGRGGLSALLLETIAFFTHKTIFLGGGGRGLSALLLETMACNTHESNKLIF